MTRGEVDPASAQLPLVLDQLVVLVEVLQPLLGCLTGVMRPVGQPFLHPQEVEQLSVVVDDVEEVEVVFGLLRIGVSMEKTAPMNSPGSTPQTSIMRSTSSAVRLRVHTLMNPLLELARRSGRRGSPAG